MIALVVCTDCQNLMSQRSVEMAHKHGFPNSIQFRNHSCFPATQLPYFIKQKTRFLFLRIVHLGQLIIFGKGFSRPDRKEGSDGQWYGILLKQNFFYFLLYCIKKYIRRCIWYMPSFLSGLEKPLPKIISWRDDQDLKIVLQGIDWAFRNMHICYKRMSPKLARN